MSGQNAEDAAETAQHERCVNQDSSFLELLLAMACHDLRQPLQIIASTNNWLDRHLVDPAERVRVERLGQGIAQLMRQLDQITEAVHIYERAHRILLQPVALQPIFVALVDEHGVEARERGIRLRVCSTSATVLTDATLLQGILRNLVRNALKYTRNNGKILICCCRRSHTRRIDVYDNGAGIPAGMLTKVFDAFQQLDPVASEGVGLGLFIVRRAAQALGHEIRVRSNVGRGSCFSVIAETVSPSWGSNSTRAAA